MNKIRISTINIYRITSVFILINLISVLNTCGQVKVDNIFGKTEIMDNDSIYAKEKRVDSLFFQIIGKKAPGAVVLVARDGKILLNKGYGYSDIESGITNNSMTRFRIASMTKQFTAFAILRLQKEGKINVKDYLSKYLPNFPGSNEIQIENLIAQTSGIFNFTRLGDSVMVDLTSRPASIDELIGLFKDKPLDFDPGTNWAYSNSGYVLLAKLIEMLSGKSYAEFLKDEFFDPLGMNSTDVINGNSLFGNDALGYRFKDNEFKAVGNWYMDWAMGGGNISSTVGDLFKWNEALYGGKIVDEKTLELALKPHPASLKNGSGYGYGLFITSSNGLESIGHGGGILGFGSYILRYPKYNLTVIVLKNMSPSPDASLESEKLARKIADIFI